MILVYSANVFSCFAALFTLAFLVLGKASVSRQTADDDAHRPFITNVLCVAIRSLFLVD